jgi:hypothetical protein
MTWRMREEAMSGIIIPVCLLLAVAGVALGLVLRLPSPSLRLKPRSSPGWSGGAITPRYWAGSIISSALTPRVAPSAGRGFAGTGARGLEGGNKPDRLGGERAISNTQKAARNTQKAPGKSKVSRSTAETASEAPERPAIRACRFLRLR